MNPSSTTERLKEREEQVMHDVLVFYATTEGQTRRIAERIASDMRARGFNCRTIDVMNPDGARVVWDNVRGVILGASLHAGRHQRTAVAFAKAFRHRLNMYPSAFFSVSLSAASANAEEVEAAARLAHEFPAAAGWKPSEVVCFAGRLAYTHYGWLTQQIMKRIAKKEGGPVDTARDHELTNWDAVARFTTRMAQEIENAEHRRFHFARPRLVGAARKATVSATGR
jgi:menaquinone-dependent protoporphyrinogen oxidase